MADTVRIQTEDFDLTQELAGLRAGNRAVGAVCAFVGTVREWQNPADANQPQAADKAVQGMTLEHYPGMTERAIQEMIVEAHQRFDFMDALVIHRIGELATCDQIVLVAVTSAHRGESFKIFKLIFCLLKFQRFAQHLMQHLLINCQKQSKDLNSCFLYDQLSFLK